MLLCKKWKHLPVRTQGIIGSFLLIGAGLLRFLSRSDIGLPDFWQGFLVGFAVVMVGVSIVINTRAVVQSYRERNR
jgi:hypothetical protein